MESFKSTLDEVREADILVHVVDISHPDFEDQISVVNQTLSDLKATDKKIIVVFNKVEAYSFIAKDDDDLTPKTNMNYSLDELKNSWMAKHNYQSVFISATEKTNIDELRNLLYEEAKKIHMVRYPGDNFLF